MKPGVPLPPEVVRRLEDERQDTVRIPGNGRVNADDVIARVKAVVGDGEKPAVVFVNAEAKRQMDALAARQRAVVAQRTRHGRLDICPVCGSEWSKARLAVGCPTCAAIGRGR